MEMIPVASSMLKAVGYDPGTQELTVQFHEGGTYAYQGVTQGVYDVLMGAQSVGHFFLGNVKNQYLCSKEES